MAGKLEGQHWKPAGVESRWDYHRKAIEVIKGLNCSAPDKVLEMGTMGVKCVCDSDTIDFMDNWSFPGKSPTYVHDARIAPWPIESDRYEVFVALRVYMHLSPNQDAALKEAFRVARHIIIVTPEEYLSDIHSSSTGIAYEQFVEMLNGIHPNLLIPTTMGWLYVWDRDRPSSINLKSITSDPFALGSTKKSITQRVVNRIKRSVS